MFIKILAVAIFAALLGCGSTPYNDDYVKHINKLSTQQHRPKNIRFVFEGSGKLDIRGTYNQDDSANASPILYQGGAGLLGMLAQIGTHSAIIDSQRNAKLARLQEQANSKIAALTDLTEDLLLVELAGSKNSSSSLLKETNATTVHLRPIFFSNEDMNQLSLHVIAWIPNPSMRKNKKTQQFIYKNMIQVHNPVLSEIHVENLLHEDEKLRVEIFSRMLTKALDIIKTDVAGGYKDVEQKSETFLIKNGQKTKVVRGTVMASTCQHRIIKSLHSWLIAYPKDNDINQERTPSHEHC